MAEHVLIHFEGEGSGTGSLTWGQRGVWRTILMDGEAKTLGGVVEVPGGTTVARVTASMRYVLGRHQSLRTKLRIGPDGEMRQVLHTSGELPLEIVDVPPGQDAAAVADALSRRYQSDPFDYEQDWPVRLGAVRQGDVISHTVAVYLHTTMDALGLTALVRDLATHLAGRPAEPVTAVQPLELAERESSPSAQRQSRASLRHMESVLRAVPRHRFRPTGATTDEHDMLHYRSPALLLAVTAVAARRGIDTSPILLGAYAVSLARVTGVSTVPVHLAVSNRFRPRMAASVAPLAQVAPCVIEVAGTTLDGVLGRAWQAAMSAYKHAYYDPAWRAELEARIDAERGEPVDMSVFFNDRRTPGPVGAGADPAPGPVAAGADPAELPARIEAARGESSLRWDLEPGSMQQSVYLDADDLDGALGLVLTVDLRKLSRESAERLVRGMEEVVVGMALDPGAPTGVSAAEPAGIT
jgi:hypothetical protein